jgi:heptaprenyl diphosphate synthase
MSNFWDKYTTIQKELQNVKKVMEQSARCSQGSMEDSLLELMNSGGKMLRPAFVIIGGGFGDTNPKRIHNLAAVIEMLHMATLIHDDIIDNASTRRGALTTQARYGKTFAVFMGDYLFAKCFTLLSKNTSMENMRSISKVISRICAGEIEQFSSRFSTEVSVNQYLRRIAAKTAALFSLSLYVGSHESGCSEKLSRSLMSIGYNIGMAFQIIDDILDYEGNEKVVGKPLGNDIKQGIFTIPLLYALKKDKRRLGKLISKKDYSDEDIDDIIDIVKELDGVDKAKRLAERYTEKAFKGISRLPDCESKGILLEVTKSLLSRNY